MGSIVSGNISGNAANVTGVVGVANGGTNSATALTNNQIMISSSGKIVEGGAMSNGQLLIGSTGSSPVVAALTGTANQVSVTNGAGSITLALTGPYAPASFTSGNILFGAGTSALATSSSFTFSTASGLSVTATSSLATTTITGLTVSQPATFNSTIGVTGTSTLATTTITNLTVTGTSSLGSASASSLAVTGTSTLATTTVTQLTANTFNGLTLTSNVDGFQLAGGTASRTLSIQGGNTTLTGANSISTSTIASSTINNITINGGGYTLSLFGNSNINQNLMTTSTPAFAGLTINGNATTTGSTTMQGPLAITTQTTPQLTLGYDANDYWSGTVGSTGGLAMAGNGTGANFTIKTQSSSVTDNYSSQNKIATAFNVAVSLNNVQLVQATCGSYSVKDLNGTTTYGTVLAKDNNCWLDRNLGATEVATSSTDYAAYGNLYQWGRAADGHQLITWTGPTSAGGTPTYTATTTLATSFTPSYPNFIANSGASPGTLYDWVPDSLNSSTSTLWQSPAYANNVCPSGFSVPTQAQWATLISTNKENITNSATAFSSSLKLPLAGYRTYDGGLYSQGPGGYGSYWSSTPNGTNAYDLYFYSTGVYAASIDYRVSGFSVRCVKD